MDQSKALQKLLEAADLTKMVEDLMDPSRENGSSLAGMRITLRSVRESIIESQTVLAKDFVARARSSAQTVSSQPQQRTSPSPIESTESSQNPVVNGPLAAKNAQPEIRSAQLGKRSLRSSVEQVRS